MSQDAPGTLVVRVTMNRRLRRAALTDDVVLLAWCAVVIVPAALLLLSRPGPGLLATAVILIAWCCWVISSTVPEARKKVRVLSMGFPTLQLDDLGVRVRDVPMDIDGASLAWTDCAAVVVSATPRGPEWPVQPARYVQFVPVSEDRVGTQRGSGKRRDVRTAMLGLSRAAARLAWLELPGSDPDTDDVIAWLRTHRPDLRLVGAAHSVNDE
jgi:hypothetical protein